MTLIGRRALDRSPRRRPRAVPAPSQSNHALLSTPRTEPPGPCGLEAIAVAAEAAAAPQELARDERTRVQRGRSSRRRAAVPARRGTDRAPFPQVSKNPEREMCEKVGSPGWARTSDFLISRRGPVQSRPLPSFRVLATNSSIPRSVWLLIARDIEVLSRQTRTREHAAREGVQRKSTQAPSRLKALRSLASRGAPVPRWR